MRLTIIFLYFHRIANDGSLRKWWTYIHMVFCPTGAVTISRIFVYAVYDRAHCFSVCSNILVGLVEIAGKKQGMYACVGYHFQFTPIWIACKHKIIKFMPQNSCLFNACVDNDRVNTMRKIVWAISIDLNTGDIFLLAIHIHWYITCIRYMITSYRSTLQRAPKWMSRKKGKVLYDSIIMKMWTHSNCWYQI